VDSFWSRGDVAALVRRHNRPIGRLVVLRLAVYPLVCSSVQNLGLCAGVALVNVPFAEDVTGERSLNFVLSDGRGASHALLS
jgi:hypothetical protein